MAAMPAGVPTRAWVPGGRTVELPGRGTTWVTDTPGPTPDAPVVVLLHALGCTGLLTWFPVLEPLVGRARVVTLDQRWHGEGIRSQPYALPDCADDVVALLDVLEVEQAVVAGYSMGSIIAQRVWRQHPERVRGLVLGASTDRFQRAPYERAFFTALTAARLLGRALPARAPQSDHAGGRAVGGWLEGEELRAWALAELRRTSVGGVHEALAGLGRHHSAPWLPAVTAPTSVVVMAHDRVIPTSRQMHLARRIPGARTFTVDAGHGGCVLDADRFVPALLAAVDDVVVRS